jgi:hypothetical protein
MVVCLKVAAVCRTQIHRDSDTNANTRPDEIASDYLKLSGRRKLVNTLLNGKPEKELFLFLERFRENTDGDRLRFLK